ADAEGAAYSVRLEQIDEAVNADLAAVAAPGDSGQVHDAGFGRAGLHRVWRGFSLGPGLQHHGDADGNTFSVRPVKSLCQSILLDPTVSYATPPAGRAGSRVLAGAGGPGTRDESGSAPSRRGSPRPPGATA